MRYSDMPSNTIILVRGYYKRPIRASSTKSRNNRNTCSWCGISKPIQWSSHGHEIPFCIHIAVIHFIHKLIATQCVTIRFYSNLISPIKHQIVSSSIHFPNLPLFALSLCLCLRISSFSPMPRLIKQIRKRCGSRPVSKLAPRHLAHRPGTDHARHELCLHPPALRLTVMPHTKGHPRRQEPVTELTPLQLR